MSTLRPWPAPNRPSRSTGGRSASGAPPPGGGCSTPPPSCSRRHGVRDLRVVDIARAVGTSPATFYQYFRDVEEAVLALAEEVGEQTAPLGELLERPWTGAGRPRPRRASWSTASSPTGTTTARSSARVTSPRRKATSGSATCATGRCSRSPRGSPARSRGTAPRRSRRTRPRRALVAMMERMAAFHVDLETVRHQPRRRRRDDCADHLPDRHRPTA